MISWRARRQLIALFIVALPLGAIGFWSVARFLPAPTCFDNRKNQGEYGVDCGGPCAPCELRNPKQISIFLARAVPVRPDIFDAVALIQNSNEELSSAEVNYEFLLFDSFGEVARKTGHTFILPQERLYVVETGLKTVRAPQSVEFHIKSVNWQFRKGERPNFIVERRDYKIVDSGGKKQSVVEASILSRSALDFHEVEVGFVALDSAGNALGVNKVLVEDFLAGSRRVVKSIWPEELQGKVALVEVEPRVNIFEQGAILKPQ